MLHVVSFITSCPCISKVCIRNIGNLLLIYLLSSLAMNFALDKKNVLFFCTLCALRALLFSAVD